ncbi:hypothetical protein LX12_001450 [Williamsia serinedens]|uniref:Uncharacterized protein n=1 Tax=Williamsia serinedens TaxID=391736 RepID=A0ABT1GZ92_9NOCA|nr:hypothetical protein [Williamsia serinedens]
MDSAHRSTRTPHERGRSLRISFRRKSSGARSGTRETPRRSTRSLCPATSGRSETPSRSRRCGTATAIRPAPSGPMRRLQSGWWPTTEQSASAGPRRRATCAANHSIPSPNFERLPGGLWRPYPGNPSSATRQRSAGARAVSVWGTSARNDARRCVFPNRRSPRRRSARAVWWTCRTTTGGLNSSARHGCRRRTARASSERSWRRHRRHATARPAAPRSSPRPCDDRTDPAEAFSPPNATDAVGLPSTTSSRIGRRLLRWTRSSADGTEIYCAPNPGTMSSRRKVTGCSSCS